MKNEDVIRLFDAYADDLYRFAVYYSGSKHEAEDIVQDVFLKLLDDKVAFKPGKEKTYLFTMTANKCRDYLRSASRQKDVDLESAENELQYFDEFNERNKAVFDELMNLDGQFRMPIVAFILFRSPFPGRSSFRNRRASLFSHLRVQRFLRESYFRVRPATL